MNKTIIDVEGKVISSRKIREGNIVEIPNSLKTNENFPIFSYFNREAFKYVKNTSSFGGGIVLMCLDYLQRDNVIKGLTRISADIVGNAKEVKKAFLEELAKNTNDSSIISQRNVKKRTENVSFVGFQIRADILKDKSRKFFPENLLKEIDPVVFVEEKDFFNRSKEDVVEPSLFDGIEEETKTEYIDLYVEEDLLNSYLYIISLNEEGKLIANFLEFDYKFFSFGYLTKILTTYNKNLLSSVTYDCISSMYYEDYTSNKLQVKKKPLTKNVHTPTNYQAFKVLGLLETLDPNELKGKTTAMANRIIGERLYTQSVSVPSQLQYNKDTNPNGVKDLLELKKKFSVNTQKLYDFILILLSEKFSYSKRPEGGMSLDINAYDFAKYLYDTQEPTENQIDVAYKNIQDGALILRCNNVSSNPYKKDSKIKIAKNTNTSVIGSFSGNDPSLGINLPPSTIRVFFDPLQTDDFFKSNIRKTLYIKLFSIKSNGESLAYEVGSLLVNHYQSFKFRNIESKEYKTSLNRVLTVKALLNNTRVWTEEEMKANSKIREKANYTAYTTKRIESALNLLAKENIIEYHYCDKENNIVSNDIMNRKYKEAKELTLIFDVLELKEDDTTRIKQENWNKSIEEKVQKKKERESLKQIVEQTTKATIKEISKEKKLKK